MGAQYGCVSFYFVGGVFYAIRLKGRGVVGDSGHCVMVQGRTYWHTSCSTVNRAHEAERRA